MADMTEPEGLADDLMPEITPPPVVTREYSIKAWHRPRKQFVRTRQWVHEIFQQVLKHRGQGASPFLTVFGLPSSEYLDLISMREMCEAAAVKIMYLGFNSDSRPAVGEEPVKPIDMYEEIQSQRMIDASSFVHPASRLVPDYFEQVRVRKSVAYSTMDSFESFDVINLDLCGCLAKSDLVGLAAVTELLRWQSTHRLKPWLFFVTSFGAPGEIHLDACASLVREVMQNASESTDFESELLESAEMDAKFLQQCFPGGKFDAKAFLSAFHKAGQSHADGDRFIRFFALSVGKWLASILKTPTPPSYVSMLPGYCFDQELHNSSDKPGPHLVSLAFLIEPAPSANSPPPDYKKNYQSKAKQILKKAYSIKNLDEIMDNDANLRNAMADQTQELLVSVGYAAGDVQNQLAPYRLARSERPTEGRA